MYQTDEVIAEQALMLSHSTIKRQPDTSDDWGQACQHPYNPRRSSWKTQHASGECPLLRTMPFILLWGKPSMDANVVLSWVVGQHLRLLLTMGTVIHLTFAPIQP